MSTLIARLIRSETMHELVRTDDGRDVLRTFVHDCEMDRDLDPEDAGAWCDVTARCGGEVKRHVAGWPVTGEVGR